MAPDSDFMMTAEEIRLRQRKRRRIFVSGLLLLLLLVLAIFGARPTVNQIKAFQARRHAAKAFAYIESENWIEARKEASAAYHREFIQRKLDEAEGNVSRAADLMGIDRSHLYRRMKALGISAR